GVLHWDLVTGRRLRRYLHSHQEEHSPILDVRFSGVSRGLFTIGAEGSLRRWGTDALEDRALLKTGPGQLTTLAISHDGKLLAVGGADGGVRVCHSESGKVVQLLAGNGLPAACLAFSRDGT